MDPTTTTTMPDEIPPAVENLFRNISGIPTKAVSFITTLTELTKDRLLDSRLSEIEGNMKGYLNQHLKEEDARQRACLKTQIERSVRDSRVDIEKNTEGTFTQVFDAIERQRAMWDPFIAASRVMVRHDITVTLWNSKA